MNYNSIGSKAITSNRTVIIACILFIALLLGIVVSSKAQTVKVADKVLKDTVIAHKSYKLYLGSRGGKYMIRVSKGTGKEYKQYFKK